MSKQGQPNLPGYVVTGTSEHVAGFDRFEAIDSSRRRVLVQPLPELSSDVRDLLVHTLATYAEVTDENLEASVVLDDEADVLVLPTAEHACLDRLDPQPASAGQVVTALVPVSEALAALHAAGLPHGGVSAENVTVDHDGRPRLGDAGFAAALRLLAPQEVAEPTIDADVEALLEMLERYAQRIDDQVLDELVLGLREDGAGSAAEIGRRLMDAAEPEPLGARDVDPMPVPAVASSLGGESTRQRWLVRSGLIAVVAVIGVVVATGLAGNGVVDGTSAADQVETPAPSASVDGEPTAPTGDAVPTGEAAPTDEAVPTGAAAPTDVVEPVSIGTELCGAPGPAPSRVPELATDWTAVIDELYLRRSAALVTGQTNLLCDVYDPRADGLVSDLETNAAYEAEGIRPDSLVFVVEAAELLERDGALLRLKVTDRLTPYRMLNEDGEAVAELPGIASDTWEARLVPDSTGTEWRFR